MILAALGLLCSFVLGLVTAGIALPCAKCDRVVKIIFLDIDGVLNSGAYFARDPRGMVFGFSDAELLNHFDPEACARLERIIVATGAKLVFSSSWRQMIDTSEAKRILAARGCLSAEFIGETPKRHRDELAEPGWSTRGAEVMEWILQHGASHRDLVILDDSHVGSVLYGRQVHTDYETGLLDEHTELAISMLRGAGL